MILIYIINQREQGRTSWVRERTAYEDFGWTGSKHSILRFFCKSNQMRRDNFERLCLLLSRASRVLSYLHNIKMILNTSSVKCYQEDFVCYTSPRCSFHRKLNKYSFYCYLWIIFKTKSEWRNASCVEHKKYEWLRFFIN